MKPNLLEYRLKSIITMTNNLTDMIFSQRSALSFQIGWRVLQFQYFTSKLEYQMLACICEYNTPLTHMQIGGTFCFLKQSLA